MIKFAKVRDVKSPVRGTNQSAGLDFFIPNDWSSRLLKPGESVLIPAGIHVDLIGSGLGDHALIFFNKSGVASKKKLDVLACVIDADYQGEIHINLVNTGTNDVILSPGDKIVQGILTPVSYSAPLQICDVSELYDFESSRGVGGFGSTD